MTDDEVAPPTKSLLVMAVLLVEKGFLVLCVVESARVKFRSSSDLLLATRTKSCILFLILVGTGILNKIVAQVLGDHSGCFKPPVDTKTNVAF